MTDEHAVVCEECGVAMNHHADKLVSEGDEAESEPGGFVLEAHSCPVCGKTATRREGEGEAR